MPSGQLGGDSRQDRLRMRAAWMYFIEQMTQNEIAETLGIGRVSVVRMLAEARGRNEVKVTIQGELAEATRLERALEDRFGIDRVYVAPISGEEADPVPAIAAVTGAYLSEAMKAGMSVGVGWGKTLLATLPFIDARSLADFKVISLLGGIGHARRYNPAEFAWRFAQVFQGDGYLMPAPAVVDSVETRVALIERCGLNEIFEMADKLDAALLSVGGMSAATTLYRGGFLKEEDRAVLENHGAVGDLLYHFYDAEGQLVDHPINSLIMSVDVERLKKVPVRILTSGGPDKVDALMGALKLIEPTVFITDEESARKMLERA
ncbi:sugar-binding transcriptional regulator [Limoniibacter endophyticus]|uniref:LacI family transcriptional regulator n=1 Tax=Limoniibacter endophyticus TaxID=1565040 RepID=A0A8J3DRF5_9HYPH|nr:sugar-binding transcriptional regulator [Limoniibacter endophyticus]GHC74991.1 LacI family transcriptional regulator [Limoniibacter endophyticus]